jgi:hypothetical protein
MTDPLEPTGVDSDEADEVTDPSLAPGAPGDDQLDFGMASDEGNERLRQVLAEVAAQVERGEVERREAVVLLSDGVERISVTHPEVTDGTVRTAIVTALDPAFVGAGWDRLTPFEF